MTHLDILLYLLALVELALILCCVGIYLGSRKAMLKDLGLSGPSSQDVLRLEWVTKHQPSALELPSVKKDTLLTPKEQEYMERYLRSGLCIIEFGPDGKRSVIRDGRVQYVFYS